MKRGPRKPETGPGLYALAVEDLYPGYFALVMATGIISTAAGLLAFPVPARILLVANLAFFVVLLVLTAARLIRHTRRLLADLRGHASGPGFFTTVAGTCVLGTQLALVEQWDLAAFVLWVFGLVLWVVLTYAFFASVVTRPQKPDLGAGIHGGWLVAVVATQSLSVLATVLAGGYPAHAAALLFLSLCFCLSGGMLYILLITLLFYRLLFRSLAPKELSPLSWISMGAAAITTLAGARLLAAEGAWEVISRLQPFLEGYTLLFWATATWWIPLLLVLTAWRARRFPVHYEPQYWSVVFPLGMYTACTFMLSRVRGLAFLEWIPRVTLWIALAAWLAAFIGMAAALVRAAAPRRG